jgi:HTH-type transcriptional regulator/antitoxin HipB
MNYPILTAAQLSSHLRSLRKARGITQTQLGRRVGLSQSRIGKIERDPALVSVGELLRILGELGVCVLLQGPAAASGSTAGSMQRSGDW